MVTGIIGFTVGGFVKVGYAFGLKGLVLLRVGLELLPEPKVLGFMFVYGGPPLEL